MVFAVSQLVSSVWGREGHECGLIPEALNLSASQRETLRRGAASYLLPGQQAHSAAPFAAPAFEQRVSPQVSQVLPVPHSCPLHFGNV